MTKIQFPSHNIYSNSVNLIDHLYKCSFGLIFSLSDPSLKRRTDIIKFLIKSESLFLLNFLHQINHFKYERTFTSLLPLLFIYHFIFVYIVYLPNHIRNKYP